jgi:hypothetical protein
VDEDGHDFSPAEVRVITPLTHEVLDRLAVRSIPHGQLLKLAHVLKKLDPNIKLRQAEAAAEASRAVSPAQRRSSHTTAFARDIDDYAKVVSLENACMA